jgi:hypothetical protein
MNTKTVCAVMIVLAGSLALAGSVDVSTPPSVRQERASSKDAAAFATNIMAAVYYPAFADFGNTANTQIVAEVDAILTNETAAAIQSQVDAVTSWATWRAYEKEQRLRDQRWRDYEIARRKADRDQDQFYIRIHKRVLRWFKKEIGE